MIRDAHHVRMDRYLTLMAAAPNLNFELKKKILIFCQKFGISENHDFSFFFSTNRMRPFDHLDFEFEGLEVAWLHLQV